MTAGGEVGILGTGGATTPSETTPTFGSIKSEIAQYFGVDGDTKRENLIGSLYQDVIDDLNRKKLWRFNLIQASPITTTPGTATIAMPADVWEIYSLRKSASIDYLLTGIEPRLMDVIFQSQAGISGYPFLNVNFNIYRNGTIILFPTPDGAYEMTLRYFKLIGKPSADQAPDMPPPFRSVPKLGAMARFAPFVDEDPSYWEAKYQEAYGDMNQMDEHTDDAWPRFINADEIGARYSYSNPTTRPRYLDFY